MHARLFANTRKLTPADLTGHAAALGLNATPFQQCLDGGKYTAKVRQDFADGKAADISSTPAFLIGPTGPDPQTVRAVTIIKGAKPYAVFKETLDKLLAERSAAR